MRSLEDEVPQDFPHEFLASVPGAQPKLLLERMSDGTYVDRSIAERRDRWQLCVDLREQLIDYVHKHLPGGTSRAAFAEQVIKAVHRKRSDWTLSVAEATWVGEQLRQHFR